MKKKELSPFQRFVKLMREENNPELKPVYDYIRWFIGRGTPSIYNSAIRRLQECNLPKEIKDKADALIVGTLKI